MKIILICAFVLTTVFLTSCEQKSEVANVNTPNTSSSLSSTISKPQSPTSSEVIVDVDKERARPVDKEVKVSNPTGKINQEIQKRINDGEIVKLYDGVCLDLNNDKKGEVIHFQLSVVAYQDIATLTIGNCQIQKAVENPSGEFFAAPLSGDKWDGIQILIYSDGPSGDPTTNIFHYEEGRLWDIGTVYCHPKNITINKVDDGFSCIERGHILQTWYKPVDYVLSTSYAVRTETEYIPPHITRVPREIYPMGTVVKLKRDLPLQITHGDKTKQFTLKSEMMISLAGTDDVEWVYIVPVDETNMPYNVDGGWLQIQVGSYNTCLIGNEEVLADDIFIGLSHAG